MVSSETDESERVKRRKVTSSHQLPQHTASSFNEKTKKYRSQLTLDKSRILFSFVLYSESSQSSIWRWWRWWWRSEERTHRAAENKKKKRWNLRLKNPNTPLSPSTSSLYSHLQENKKKPAMEEAFYTWLAIIVANCYGVYKAPHQKDGHQRVSDGSD